MVSFEKNPMADDAKLNELFARSWPGHISRPFAGVLARSLGFIGAFDRGQLVGFVNVGTDGGEMEESVPTPSLLSVIASLASIVAVWKGLMFGARRKA